MTSQRVHTLIVEPDENELAYQYMYREGETVPPLATFRKPADLTELHALTERLGAALSARSGDVEAGVKNWGGRLYDRVIPADLAAKLRADAGPSYLVLYVHPALVWLPWELLWDGEEFVCRRFRVARQLQKQASEYRAAEQRLREERSGRGALLVFGATTGISAEAEKSEVERALSPLYRSNIWFQQPRHAADLLELLKQDYEVCHFIGHGRYVKDAPGESGWMLTDGTALTCRDIEQVSSKAAFPLLIFANSCDSTHSSFVESEGYVSTLYRAFLRVGVPHYIGSIAPVPDQPSKDFAGTFWRLITQGLSVGEALAETRRVFVERSGSKIWACYTHYGDPTYRMVRSTQARAASYTSGKDTAWDETLKERTSFSLLGRSSQEELYRMLNHHKSAIAKNPEDEEAHFALGLSYLQLGLHDLTVKNFQRCVELEPAHADAYYYLALSMIRGRRPKTLSLSEVRIMEQHLETAMRLDPRRAKYWQLAAILKADYFLANGLKLNGASPAALLEMAGDKEHDPWETERLLAAVILRDQELISRIRRSDA